MKIARYRKPSGELYVSLMFLEDEWKTFCGREDGLLMQPVKVLKAGGNRYCVKPTHPTQGGKAPGIWRKGDHVVVGVNLSNFLPGSEVFGVEELRTTIVEGEAEFDEPVMGRALARRNGGERAKTSTLATELREICEAVDALNARRRAFRGLVFTLDEQGYIQATVSIS